MAELGVIIKLYVNMNDLLVFDKQEEIVYTTLVSAEMFASCCIRSIS